MASNDPVTTEILAFLDRIGIPVLFEALDEDTLLPAMTVGWGRAAREPTGMAEVTRAGMARIIHSGLEWGSAGLEAGAQEAELVAFRVG